MLEAFEITRSKVEKPDRCTIVGPYSGKRCPESGTVELVVIARFNDERGREPFRHYRICPKDAGIFIEGFRARDVKIELTDV